MKISKKFPQFERFPALFITSGEYEALFYLASSGNIDLIETVKKTPREEASEKQAFVGKKSGMFDPVAVSHRGAYREDLKMKFARAVHVTIRSIMATHRNIEGIYLFAPRYVSARITKQLNAVEGEEVRMSFYGEYTKKSPLYLVETFFKEIEKMKKTPPLSRRDSTLIPMAAGSDHSR